MSVIELNKDSFKEEVLNSNNRVLVDFYANWCGPCKMLRPIIEEVSNENKNVKVASINIDNNDELAMKYNVSAIPCLILFENGKELKRSIGLVSKDEVETIIGDN